MIYDTSSYLFRSFLVRGGPVKKGDLIEIVERGTTTKNTPKPMGPSGSV